MKRRKFLILIIAFLLVLSEDIKVFATSNTYELPQLGLEVAIPSHYSVVTREMSEDHPVFGELGISKSSIISEFEANYIYLNALSSALNEEIVVTMTENSAKDFNELDDISLQVLASALSDQYSNYGFEILKSDTYQQSQTKFIRLYFTDTSDTVYGLQYYTIYDGKAMNFTMRSYTGELSQTQESTIQAVVDSIKYKKTSEKVEVDEEVDSLVYEDQDNEVTFVVPVNWKQEEFTQEREFIDAKFVSTIEKDRIIIYGSVDLWEKISASERIGITREEVDNSFFTKADMAEMYGLLEEDISIVTYNGVQYYQGETITSSDEYGIDVAVTMTQLVHIHNGWLYTFQFSSTSEHHLYSDFEDLLNSVQYTKDFDISGEGLVDDSVSMGSSEKTPITETLAAVLVLVIIVIVVIVLLISKKKKANMENSYSFPLDGNMSHNENVVSQNTNTAPTIIWCPNCGQALSAESVFCHACGAKIEKDI